MGRKPKYSCENCIWADWEVDTTSGKEQSAFGICGVNFKPPHSYGTIVNMLWSMPVKKFISKATMPNCPCWASLEEK